VNLFKQKKRYTSKNYIKIVHSQGEFRSACGQQYFIGKSNKTFIGALEECCKYGLKLLSVESQEEFDCIFDMNKGFSYNNNTFNSQRETDLFCRGAAFKKYLLDLRH